jgi:eukaryotic translation initiation factor 2C
MCSMIKERIQAWSKWENKDKLPSQIIFYRDGVSESQFKICQQREISQSEEAYRQLNGNPKDLKITFLVVGNGTTRAFTLPKHLNRTQAVVSEL